MRSPCARPGRRLVALALLLCGGCLWSRPTQSGTWLRSLRPNAGPVGDDVVVLQVSVIEQQVGDRSVNRDLWTSTDELAVTLDRRAVLEDNGFRVAVAGGSASETLNDLLKSKRSNPDPHQIQTRTGTTKTILLGGLRPSCAFRLKLDGEPTPAEFDQAQCAMAVTPTFASDGRVALSFVPQVQHGAPKLLTHDEHGEFVLQGRRPAEPYPGLSFEVTLGAQDYVVVGTWAEKDATLGHCCFVTSVGAKPTQRLLVIRAARQLAPAVTDEETATTTAAKPPLAYQATLTVRGQKD
jgi:hypothetical protein